jgi:hypothetical protein
MIITEIFFYKTSNALESSIHESQYILILLSKGLCWQLLSTFEKGKIFFVLLSSTLTYACMELEHHLEVLRTNVTTAINDRIRRSIRSYFVVLPDTRFATVYRRLVYDELRSYTVVITFYTVL